MDADDDNAHSSAFRITSVIDVALSGCSLLLLLCGWVYVVVHCHRPLCALRIALGLTATLWVVGVVASHGAIWSLVELFVGSSQQPGSRRTGGGWDREQLCGVHAAVTLGFSEPASLLLIASLIRAKTLPRRAAHPSWRLMRRSLGLAMLLASLQALVVGLSLSGAWRHSVVLEPLPPVLNASDGAALEHEVWWRDETGCANSIASVGVCTLFVVPFELYWALTCYRLLGLIINLRLKARLYCVQLTYTLVPVLLLLLRIALLVYAANWTNGRRLMRDAELLLVLLAGVIAARSLIWRPVHENVLAAPLASTDAAAPEEDAERPLHPPPLEAFLARLSAAEARHALGQQLAQPLEQSTGTASSSGSGTGGQRQAARHHTRHDTAYAMYLPLAYQSTARWQFLPPWIQQHPPTHLASTATAV